VQTARATADPQRTVAALAESRPVILDVRDRIGRRRSVGQLQDEVHGYKVDDTALVRVDVADSDPALARDIANAVLAVLPQHDPTQGGLLITGAGMAVRPRHFSDPDVWSTVLIGAGIGIVVAVAGALLREAKAGRVDDPRQLARLTGSPVLASVTRPSDPDSAPTDAPITVGDQFRTLRVALEFATSDEPTSTLVLAPVAADPAAAWTTVHLASALAQVDHRVLLIDADITAKHRHPALRGKGPGLIDALRGTVDLRDAVRPCPVSGVSVLPVGNVRGVAAANLIEVRFHGALARIGAEVDLALVQAAPVTESDDARVMAAGNALVLIVGAGRTRGAELRQLADDLRRQRLRVLGSVLLKNP
jgi:Mrp family chromosome partitioning ATPase